MCKLESRSLASQDVYHYISLTEVNFTYVASISTLALNLDSPVQILLHDHCVLFRHYGGETKKVKFYLYSEAE